MAFYDTQSQLLNMARSKDGMASIIQNRANAQANLSKENAQNITKTLQNMAQLGAGAIEEETKKRRDRELLSSVVPTLGATQDQKEALLKAKDLSEAANIAKLQQSNTTTKSLGYGNGLITNNWTGETQTFLGRGGGSKNQKPQILDQTEAFMDDVRSMSQQERQELIDSGGLYLGKTGGSDNTYGYYPTPQYKILRSEQIKKKSLGK